MRVNLYLTHCGLLFITLISSCFLFYVVAQENAKYVANTAAGGVAAASSSASDVVAETHNSSMLDKTADAVGSDTIAPPSPLNEQPNNGEEVLPNYKKVHKSKNDDVDENTVLAPSIDDIKNVQEKVVAIDKTRQNLDTPQSLSASENERPIAIEQEEEEEVKSVVFSKTENKVIQSEDENLIETQQKQPPLTEYNTQESQAEKPNNDAGASGDANERDTGLPDIKEIPTLTVTELPLEILEPSASHLDAIIIESTTDSLRDPENITVDILENSNEAMQKDEQIIKINDSGGGVKDALSLTQEIPPQPPSTGSAEIAQEDVNIPSENATAVDASSTATAGNGSEVTVEATTTIPSTLNLTAEEVPMPVFSEWAQKQMEAAEKQQAMEQDVVNTSALKKNNTNGNGRQAQLKIRAKNYASPDCGAKIISSNADASSPPAVLNSHKDEYMLSPCGNRIWFVVELCEAIQAQRIDLANFELFSSSPKNFTVAVSNRFPTRDWSNVGRFVAEDKRTVQTFELHPHLFGKFVRVDIHSHYSKEHFCPVSLFRVFGTSEFEAFETENQQHDDLDDFDEDFAAQEQALGKNAENNLFKSASDAVFSIMKKAAEALVKPVNNLNQSFASSSQSGQCYTRISGQFSCADCNQTLVDRINTVLSCEPRSLNSLLNVALLRDDLRNTQICAKQYGLALLSTKSSTGSHVSHALEMDTRRSFFINILPSEYVGALCQLLMEGQNTVQQNTNDPIAVSDKEDPSEVPLNLTINKKQNNNAFEIIGNREKIPPPQTNHNESDDELSPSTIEQIAPIPTTETTFSENAQIPRPSEIAEENDAHMQTTTPEPKAPKEPAPDVNIFNVPEVASVEVDEEWSSGQESSGDQPTTTTTAETTTASTTSAPPVSTTTTATATAGATTTTAPPTTTMGTPSTKVEDDPSSWDSFETLLTSTAAPNAGGNSGGFNGGNSIQHKIPSSPQSESVFIRLSNRLKALERNMSLSGQYLEELSRRYKKQVEELQLALTQQTLTVRSLEQQIHHQNGMELVYAESNAHLKRELNDLTLQVHACIVVTVVVGVLVMLIFLFGFIYYRKMHRQTLEMLVSKNCKRNACPMVSTSPTTQTSGKKLNRRKSYEDFSVHQRSIILAGGSDGGEKMRRSSEEASMLILHGCCEAEDPAAKGDCGQLRQRKISVCYGVGGGDANLDNVNLNNPSIGAITNGNGHVNNVNNNYYKAQSGKRKGEKHSWPNSGHALQHAWQRLEELDEYMNAEEYAGQQSLAIPVNGKAKKKAQLQQLKRQESAPPSEYAAGAQRLNVTAPGKLNCSPNTTVSYDETLILDDEDLDNFIPNADLAYNEFMPEGPSGYQINNDDDSTTTAATATTTQSAEAKNGKNSTAVKKSSIPTASTVATKTATEKKSRRLSSPAFFKSPFTKNLKGKRLTASLASSSSSSNSSHTKLHNNSIPKTNTPHESTSWEWYRLRNKSADSKHLNTSTSATNFAASRVSPNASVDSSSLSEINFPSNYTENSFRILEEAILISGEGVAKATKGSVGGSNASSSSGGDSSNRSSTSSTAKKKSRSFNRIFRKVF